MKNKKRLVESIFSDKLEEFLTQKWSRPVERNFVNMIAKNKANIIKNGEQGKEYLNQLLTLNKNLLEDSCTDEFVDEMGRLGTEYEAGDSMGLDDKSKTDVVPNENFDDESGEAEDDNEIGDQMETPNQSDDSDMGDDQRQNNKTTKMAEAKEIKIDVKPHFPSSIKLKVDIWNHDATEDEIEKDGTCLAKKGSTLKWDDVQKAYKSGDKIVRPGLLHPSMYEVVGEDTKLSDKLPNLKKESAFTKDESSKAVQGKSGLKSDTPGFNSKTKKTWAINGPGGALGESEIIHTGKDKIKLDNFLKAKKTIVGVLINLKNKKGEELTSKEFDSVIKKVGRFFKLDELEIGKIKDKFEVFFVKDGLSESKQLEEKPNLEADSISVSIHPLKGQLIPVEQAKQIAQLLHQTYGVKPSIKGSYEKSQVKEINVDTFSLDQLTNLRDDLKSISKNLEVDSVTLPNADNNTYTDGEEEIAEASRDEKVASHGQFRVYEDESLENVEKIVNEAYDEIVNFHKDHTDIVDPWKDIQSKTPTSHTVIQEDPSKGKQMGNVKAKVEDPFDTSLIVTDSKTVIEEKTGGVWPKKPNTTSGGKWEYKEVVKKIKKHNYDIMYAIFVAPDGSKETGAAVIKGQNKEAAMQHAKEIALSKMNSPEPMLQEDPQPGVQMGNKKAKEEYPWEDYGIKSEWIEEAVINEVPTERTNFSFQELNNQKKNKQFVDKESKLKANENAQLRFRIKNKITDLEQELQDAYAEQESDPEVYNDSDNGQNPAVIMHGRKIQKIENAITKLSNKLRELSETVQNPTLTDMQHNVLDENREDDDINTAIQFPTDEERGGPKPPALPFPLKTKMKEAAQKIGKPEGGQKGIDDRVKEQEDKDESLEQTEECYCNKEEWEKDLKELYKGKTVKFEDESYAIVAYVDDEEVGEWKENTASGGTGKIWFSMFDDLELIEEASFPDYTQDAPGLSATGIVGGLTNPSGLLEDDDLEECNSMLHEDMTTADMAVPDQPIGPRRNINESGIPWSGKDVTKMPIIGKIRTKAMGSYPSVTLNVVEITNDGNVYIIDKWYKQGIPQIVSKDLVEKYTPISSSLDEVDRFFSEWVVRNCDVKKFIKEGKFDLNSYMNSRPYSFQKILFEAYNKECEMKENAPALGQVVMDESFEFMSEAEIASLSELPEIGNEEEIHDHLRINENDMDYENYHMAFQQVKREVITLEKEQGGVDASDVSEFIDDAKLQYGLSDAEVKTLHVDIFDWRREREF